MLREMLHDTEAAAGPCPDVPVLPAARPRVLMRPAVHPAVRDAQRRLNQFHRLEVSAGRPGLDRAPLNEDCMFGPTTVAAVISFQRIVFPGRPNEHDGKIGPKTWAQLDLVGIQPTPVAPIPIPAQPMPAEPLPVPAPIPAPVPTLPPSQLCDAIARTAEAEFRRWRPGGAGPLQETDAAATPILQQYYRDGVNVTVSAADLQSAAWQSTHPWSAVFVSWVMRTAGAGASFAYSRAHQTYIRAARRHRLTANLANPFWAFPATDVVPQVGDLVCASRAHSGATYENIGDPQFRATHCDVVTGIGAAELRAIGGNVNQTVGAKRIRLAADGRLRLDGNQSDFFAVVRCSGPTAQVPALAPTPTPAPQAPARGTGASSPATGVSSRVVANVERYRGLIDAAAQRYGVDAALISGVIAAESGGNPDLVARSGYTGLMQAGTDASHTQPATSIDAGARKLRDFRSIMDRVLRERGRRYDQLPDVEQVRLLALAYNAGPVSVAKALQYATSAGNPDQWLDAEHYKRALLFTGAYSIKQAGPSCLRDVPPTEHEGRRREASRVRDHWRLGTKSTPWRRLPDPPSWGSVSPTLPLLLVCAIDFKHRNAPQYVNRILAYRRHFGRS